MIKFNNGDLESGICIFKDGRMLLYVLKVLNFLF
jgi:hypothetical protein